MTASDELLPCPFCGAKARHGKSPVRYCQLHGDPYHDYRIWCGSHFETAHARREAATFERAAEAWNRRHIT